VKSMWKQLILAALSEVNAEDVTHDDIPRNDKQNTVIDDPCKTLKEDVPDTSVPKPSHETTKYEMGILKAPNPSA